MSAHKLPELPENVVRLRPDVVVRPSKQRRPKKGGRPRSMTTAPSDLITKTTTKRAKKPKPDKMITLTSASLQLDDDASVSSSLLTPARDPNDAQTKAAFRKFVRGLGAMELRERFPLEAASHSNMMARVRTHGAVIHPEFKDFRSFLLHVGARPVPTWTLDRVNPHDPEYAPKKVRWLDKRSQSNNRRNTILLTVRGEIRPLTDWARFRDQDPKTLRARLDRGWTHEEVVYGRNERAPEDTEPPAPMPETEGYVWPGSKAHMWEAAFRSFVAFARTHWYFKECPRSAFTRDVFLGWIGTNIVASASRQLGEKYPGYGPPVDGNPDHQDPPEARADPLFHILTVFDRPAALARSRVRADRGSAQGLLEEVLLRNFRRVTTFARPWSEVFARFQQWED